jgi:hypothetical protein
LHPDHLHGWKLGGLVLEQLLHGCRPTRGDILPSLTAPRIEEDDLAYEALPRSGGSYTVARLIQAFLNVPITL